MSKVKTYRIVSDVSESLSVRAPHLLPELIRLPDGATPENIYPSANIMAVWRCSTCLHVWEAKINNRFNGRGCPVCSNRLIIPGVNDFASSPYNSLLSEWNYKKNSVLPTELSPRSGVKVWWLGACGHEWFTSIHSRTTNGKVKGCPACATPARLVISGFNDFASVAPHLVKYWSQDNASAPETTLAGSRKTIIWVCDSGHQWNAPVYDMLVGVTGCVQCSDSRNPKIEVAIFSIIKEKYKSAELHYKLPLKWDSGHQFEVDIWIPEFNSCIEWDGARWHGRRVERDTEKTNKILSSGRRVVRLRNSPLPMLEVSASKSVLLQIATVWTLDKVKLENMLQPVFNFLEEGV